MSRIIRAKYEGGVLKPLEPVELREGEEVLVEIREDIVGFATHVRSLARAREEPSTVLSREKGRLG